MKFSIALLLWILGCVYPAPAQPPNILLILVDDMGYGDPGCVAMVRATTPGATRWPISWRTCISSSGGSLRLP